MKRKRNAIYSSDDSPSSTVCGPVPLNGNKCRRRLFSGSDDGKHGKYFDDYDDVDGAGGSGENKNEECHPDVAVSGGSGGKRNDELVSVYFFHRIGLNEVLLHTHIIFFHFPENCFNIIIGMVIG